MNKPSQRLGSSMLVVGGGILLSRVLGLVRDVTFARQWGTGTAFAAFVIAFTIPNLFRALFGEGAFAAAFVPVFSGKLEKRGVHEAWSVAQRVISVLALVLTAAVIVVAGIGVVGRFASEKELAQLTFRLLPWLMPYALLICLTGAFAAVLNSMHRFALPAFTSAILNLVLVVTTVVVCPLWGGPPQQRVLALALAVLLAGLLQLGVQILGCRRLGLLFRFSPDWQTPEVRQVALLMAPVLVGTGVAQLNVAADRLLAALLGSTATSALYYSQRLVYLPVGLFGVAMAVVCLPAMSRAWARDDVEDMQASLCFALRHVVFLSVPVAVLLGLTAVPVVRLLFERGTFDATSTAETVWALLFYVPGIPAFACAKVAVTPFHARQDTRTPVKIAAVCLGLNIVLNLSLMWFMRQAGLALATTLCSYLNVGLLLSRTRKELGGTGPGRLLASVARCCMASALAAVAAWLAWNVVDIPPAVPRFIQHLLAVVVPLGTGSIAYVGLSWLLGSPELRELVAAVAERVRRKRSATPPRA